MSGVVLTPDQLKEFRPDSGVKLSTSDMKDFVPEGKSQSSQTSAKATSRPWSDVPKEAVKNVLPSLGRTAENIGSALMHPLNTAEGIVRGASGGLDLAMKAAGLHPSQLYHSPEEYQKDVATAHQMMNHLKSRYGSEEAIKNTLATDPAGALLDASAILSPVSGILRKAGLPGAGEIVGKVTQAPVALATKGVKSASKAVGNGVAQTLGRMTGTSAESVAASVKGNPGFVKQMRGDGSTEESLASDALKRISDLKAARSNKYEADLAGMGNPELATSPMVGHFVNRMKKENVSVSPASKKLDFSKSSLGYDEGLPQIDTAHQLFRNAWQKKNIGFQEAVVLKHQVGNLLDKTKPGSRAHAVMIDLKKGIDTVLNQHPGYRKMNRAYQAQSNVIDQIEKAFSLKQAGRKNVQAILTKMQTHGRRHNQFARDLLEKLDPSEEVSSQMYGLEMKPWFRRGMEAPLLWGEGAAGVTGGLTHSATLPGTGLGLIAASSPRIVGEAGNLLGKAGRGASALAGRSRLPASGLLALLEEEGALGNGQ